MHKAISYSKQRGFTLIEIMVAVAILGAIASIAIPVYNGYTDSARATECSNEVAAIRLAEEEFFLVNNTYFAGTGASAIATASSGVYQASPAALSANSICDYTVSAGPSGIATQYQISATPRTGGPLAGTGVNITAQNY